MRSDPVQGDPKRGRTMRGALTILCAIAVLVLVNLSIAARERQLASGRLVYLELAPVDPRSLMQGDYMALRYRMAADVRAAIARAKPPAGAAGTDSGDLDAQGGRVVAALDDSGVATYQRPAGAAVPGANEIMLRYRVRNGQVQFGTNAFFFQEGSAARYQSARYGAFRVTPDGELLLTGLCDKDRNAL